MKKAYLFDWGDTIMRDFPEEKGPMCSWKNVEIMPFANTMLQMVTARADCYLVTNARDSSKEDIVNALKRVNLEKYFKDIFCYKELGVSKPSKEYFDIVLERICLNKDEVLMVGDNLDLDISGARDYGIDAVLYDPSNAHTEYKGAKVSKLIMVAYLY